MATASRVGTIDPMGKNRVYTDETLKVVPAGSIDAAFVWKRGDLEARKARREELGLDKNDEALRAFRASQKAQVPTLERQLASLKAQLEDLQAAIAVAEGDASSGTSSSGSAPRKADLQAEAKSLGLDDGGTVAELSERIAAHKAASSN
jgi:hypothetical protein